MGAEGVKWVSNASSPTLARYHGASGSNTLYSPASQAVATTYFDALAPWGSMGRLSLRPDGSTSSRCLTHQTSLQTAANWGDNCYSDTDQTGSEQKMVYVPQFCYACDTLTANQTWWWIGQVGDTFRKSDNSGDYTFTNTGTGFEAITGNTNGDIHPAFIVDSVAKAGAYVGAYEGYNSSSVLQSVAGVAPTVSTTKANFRTYAEAIGAGWELYTIQQHAALQMLFTIEYASLYSGNVLGQGDSNTTTQNTGYTAMGGTVSSGNASYGDNSVRTKSVSYRGVEQLWGNIEKFVEGIRTDTANGIWIAAQTRGRTYSDTSTLSPTGAGGVGTVVGAYTNTGSVMPASLSGYLTAISPDSALSWMFFPSAASGGSGATYFCSNASTSAIGTSRIFNVGAHYNSTNGAGIYAIAGNQSYTVSNPAYGARLAYFPQ
jgi:hypothetical protein